VTADVPFLVIGVPLLRSPAPSSNLQVSFSFIHTNDMPISAVFPFPLGGEML
jgi:hypothetical protein